MDIKEAPRHIYVDQARSGLVHRLVALLTPTVGVKIKSVKKLEQRENVYNMTVEKNHNYLIGNNIWSKNCDALRYGCEKLGKLSIEL